MATEETLYEKTKRLTAGVKCPPYEFDVLQHDCGCVFVVAKLWRTDVDTGEEGWGYGSKQWIDPEWPNDVIAKRTFVAAMGFAEHEVREGWEIDGRRVFSPHMPLRALWEIAPEVNPTVDDDLEWDRLATITRDNGETDYLVYCQRWYESEAGWGQRPDGWTLSVSAEDNKEFVDAFLRAQVKAYGPVPPPTYTRPDGDPYLITVSKDIAEQVLQGTLGWCFDPAPMRYRQ